MLSSTEEASLRESLRFREEDRWLHLLYRQVGLILKSIPNLACTYSHHPGHPESIRSVLHKS